MSKGTPLTPVERYHAARRAHGHPYTITALVTYAAPPTADALAKRIGLLLERMPRLRSVIRSDHWQVTDTPGSILEHGEASLLPAPANLWRVTLGPSHVSISVAHELMDGRGLLNLVRAFLTDIVIPDETTPPPTLEQTVNMVPSWTAWLTQHALRLLPSPTLWPGAHPPPTLPGRVASQHLDSALVDSLKQLSKWHGIPTLTPVLQLAFLLAIWACTRAEWSGPYTLGVITPLDERDAHHALCTGQHVVPHYTSLEMRGEFWSTARAIARDLALPSTRIQARANLYNITNTFDTPASVSFSNLGATHLPPGATDLVVAGSPSIGDPPFEVVLCGHAGGIRLTTAYRDGGATPTATVEAVHAKWESMLRSLIVDGKEVTIA